MKYIVAIFINGLCWKFAYQLFLNTEIGSYKQFFIVFICGGLTILLIDNILKDN